MVKAIITGLVIGSTQLGASVFFGFKGKANVEGATKLMEGAGMTFADLFKKSK